MLENIVGAIRGVSNWRLFFDDQVIFIDTVHDETITYYSDGIINITINDCMIRNTLINEIKNKNNIYKLEREAFIRDIKTGEDIPFVETFNDMKILYIINESAIEEISNVSMYINNKKII